MIPRLWVAACIALVGVQPSRAQPPPDGAKSTPLFQSTAEELGSLSQGAPFYKLFTEFVKYGVRAYRLEYTTNDGDRPITVSGAVLVPDREDAAPILVWCHGTVFDRMDVASRWTDPGHIELVPAASGIITFIPDYIGYGSSSRELHPYVVMDGLVPSVLDMIPAGRELLRSMRVAFDERLFFWGFSEGAFAALGALRELEERPRVGLNVTACFPVAGPYRLRKTLDVILAADEYDFPEYLAYLFGVYNARFWERPLTDFFQEPHATEIGRVLSGEAPLTSFGDSFPTDLPTFFNPEFLQAWRQEGEASAKRTFEDNSDFDWVPSTPVHFYHGTADADVPYEIAKSMHEDLVRLGADPQQVTLTIYEELDHTSTALTALYAFLRAVGD